MLAGYSALLKAYDLKVPLPSRLCAISHKHAKYQKNAWMMYTPRHAPEATLFGHFSFALKNEGIELAILKALFDVIDPNEVVKIVKSEPTGSYSRKLWFLYEWLQNTKLDLPDATKGNFINVLDDRLQYSGPERISARHRVRNNLPGVPGFCPMIRKTERLGSLVSLNLGERAKEFLESVRSDVLLRAAAFMLLKDSKASFAIEGETPPQNRAERWGRAIGQAGHHCLSHDELLRLQEIVIADFRFIQPGYRIEGGFIGEHERGTGLPIPDHISARPEDVSDLMDSLISVERLHHESELDPVLSAAIIAFGFVFIHPFEDGNGRIHRYLIHHVLSERGFTAAGIVFPVSSVMLNRISQYKKVLESYSRPRLPFIEWFPTDRGNVEVTNETINLYRYFDVTDQAEFLYECIKETVEKTLPEEIDYLKKHDEMKTFITNYLELPDHLIELLMRFLIQEHGRLSKRARKKEFSALTDQEAETLERKFSEIFEES